MTKKAKKAKKAARYRPLPQGMEQQMEEYLQWCEGFDAAKHADGKSGEAASQTPQHTE